MEADTPNSAGDALKSALKTVDKLSVYDDPAAPMRPPLALVGAPTLRAEVGSTISHAVFPVVVAVASTARTLAVLMGLLPQVVEAIEGFIPDATVQEDMEPITLQVEGHDELPAYLLMVDVSV